MDCKTFYGAPRQPTDNRAPANVVLSADTLLLEIHRALRYPIRSSPKTNVRATVHSNFLHYFRKKAIGQILKYSPNYDDEWNKLIINTEGDYNYVEKDKVGCCIRRMRRRKSYVKQDGQLVERHLPTRWEVVATLHRERGVTNAANTVDL